MNRILISLCIILTFNSTSFAQTTIGKYQTVDRYVNQIGSLDSQNVAKIAVALTRSFSDNEEKARAIFYWIAHNIAIDPKATKGNNQKFSLPEDVIKYRKATPLGFAKLFQEMSSMAKIRCLVVDGYIKNEIEELNSPADEINHSWNVIQLGQSPEQWFFVDTYKASGITDKKMSVFTPEFTSGYFFADKTLFNLDHYPDNDAWQLGGGPKGLKSFYALPIIYNIAYNYGLKKPTPSNGLIKTKTQSKVNFSIPVNTGAKIGKVSLLIGEGRRLQKPEPMNFTFKEGSINFDYQFKTEDTFPVKVLIDGKPILEYMVESSE